MKPSYKELKAGDIRQRGDEYRKLDLGPGPKGYVSGESHRHFPGEYHKVTTLFGQAILASDLMHLNFRRPINE